MNIETMSNLNGLQHAIETVKKLRDPDGGCPWDLKQTVDSLRPFMIEEAYEAAESMTAATNASQITPEQAKHIEEELGDVLLQVLLNAQILSEWGLTDLDKIAENLHQKLVRRHPHVFEKDQKLGSADEVVSQWSKIKDAEKAKTGTPNSTSYDVPTPQVLKKVKTAQPVLQRTMKVIDAVTKVGFQWPDPVGPLHKLKEEVEELSVEVKNNSDRVESELGDVLFSTCNIAHMFKINPETALIKNLERFQRRFEVIESTLLEQGKKIEDQSLEELDQIWKIAKKQEQS